jgi:hypothetical protein
LIAAGLASEWARVRFEFITMCDKAKDRDQGDARRQVYLRQVYLRQVYLRQVYLRQVDLRQV